MSTTTIAAWWSSPGWGAKTADRHPVIGIYGLWVLTADEAGNHFGEPTPITAG